MEYVIKIDSFEGPLDVLLYLIKQNKMDIFEISVSEITDKYLEYLYMMETLNLDIASDFLVMAATLLNIKSRKLLPIEKEEDELTEEDIINKLTMYKKYKELSEKIEELYKTNFGSFLKPIEKIKFIKEIKYQGEVFSKDELYKIMLEIKDRNIKKINIKRDDIDKLAILEKISVKDKINEIRKYLKNNSKIIFNEYFNMKEKSSVEIVTAFLGMLELKKQNQIDVIQDKTFSNIIIKDRMLQ